VPRRRLACLALAGALSAFGASGPALAPMTAAAAPSIAPPEVAPVLAAIALRAERDRAAAEFADARWSGSLADLRGALAAAARADSLYEAALSAIGEGAAAIPRAVVSAAGMGARPAALAAVALDLGSRGRWRAADALLSGAALRGDPALLPARAVARSRADRPVSGLALLGWPPERRRLPDAEAGAPDAPLRAAGPAQDLRPGVDLTLWTAAALSDSAGLRRSARAALWILTERSGSPTVRRLARLALARHLADGGEPRIAAAALEAESGRSVEETLLLARLAASVGDTLASIRWGLGAAEQARTAAERYAALLPAARGALAGRADSLEERPVAALVAGLGNLGEPDLALRLLEARTIPADSASAASRSQLRASLLIKARRFAEAAEAYRSLLAAAGTAPPAERAPLALGLARALRGDRAFESMDSAFTLAAAAAPTGPVREAAAWERAREWEDRRPAAEAAPVFAWARELLDAGPLAAAATLHTALAWDRAGRSDSARALLASPRDSEGALWFWQARFALASGDTATARYAFIRAAQATPLSYEGVRAREEIGLPPLLTAPGGAPRAAVVPVRSAVAPGFDAALAEFLGLPDLAGELLRDCAQRGEDASANGCIDALEARGVYRVGRRTPESELRLTRPPAFPRAVLAAAGTEDVDPALLWALMLQESAFDAGARSRAGAIGLLQLLPTTASRLAGRAVPADSLTDPGLNVRLAARYVAGLLSEFRDPRAAIAAYNAGEDAVRRWLADRPVVDDRWVELIPYRETRDYVKSVYTTWRQYAAVYAAR
jgi:soluble lytic murein transglycosylase-like protein